MIKYTLIISSLFYALLSQIKTVPKHPIDIEVEKCHQKEINQTTMGMIGCEQLGFELWDKELNKFYLKLMEELKYEEKESLRLTQRSWIVFRDREFNFSDRFYANLQGTMWGIVAISRRREVTRARALELKAYVETLVE
jgi:uncharacterized protein YecT (DUF1311 family)